MGSEMCIRDRLIEDCQWNSWESWSMCTKPCIKDTDKKFGTANRKRDYVEPRNGGLECDADLATEDRNCPRIDPNDSASSFLYCPGKTFLICAP